MKPCRCCFAWALTVAMRALASNRAMTSARQSPVTVSAYQRTSRSRLYQPVEESTCSTRAHGLKQTRGKLLKRSSNGNEEIENCETKNFQAMASGSRHLDGGGAAFEHASGSRLRAIHGARCLHIREAP